MPLESSQVAMEAGATAESPTGLTLQVTENRSGNVGALGEHLALSAAVLTGHSSPRGLPLVVSKPEVHPVRGPDVWSPRLQH